MVLFSHDPQRGQATIAASRPNRFSGTVLGNIPWTSLSDGNRLSPNRFADSEIGLAEIHCGGL
jgi:hypothetical protein